MTVRKVRPKQVWKPPAAADHNAMGAAADMYRRGPDGQPERQQPINGDVVLVRNSTGTAKRRFEVVSLSRTPILTTLTREQVYVAGGTPAAGGMPKMFAIFLDPCENARYAPAQIAGICPALVYVNAVTDHFCDLPSGEDRFVSNVAGPIPIVQQPNATGEQICMVNLSYQEESHLVGVPVGDGITARSVWTAGSGVVQLYYLNGSNLTAVLEGGEPVYLNVYSLADDPILPQANHTFPGIGGDLFYGSGVYEDYYLLHCDQFGVWWIEKETQPKVAQFTSDFSFYVGTSLTQPITSSGFTWAAAGSLVSNLDGASGNDIFTALGVTLPADWAFCTVNRTADYHLAYSWYGGSVSAAAQVYHWLEYQQGGSGAWANLFPTLDPYLPFSGLAGGVHKATSSDGTGASGTTVIRLNKNTRIRGQISVAGGPTLSSPIRACLTAISTS